ncbi:hypothetical protein [Spiroplasma floricola]|uniref:Uncharacterized protein n=1 Tax=Spiroplasma floricola 23-6 TaxID=1336749 RepID=A0A2K8SDX9_9MOLU|nr:hypothetical protein [Spiroplasma floricola]AUB31667.1 hypothetical protein SFLOR_v1c06170 [Spiroplasma floricola 23-6]
MKKLRYLAILIFSLLIGASLFFIANTSFESNSIHKTTYDNYVYFKVKFDITLLDKEILPVKLKNNNNTNKTKDFLKENKLTYLENLFEIENNKNLKKNNTILFYPKDTIEVLRISRFEVKKEFFTSRSISETLAEKSVDIFLDTKNSFEECMTKLQEIYKGTFNAEFYKKALPKLIY